MATSIRTTTCLLAFLIVFIIHQNASASRPIMTEMLMRARHEQWMTRNGRVYKNEAEKEHRYNIFKTNVEFADSFNADNGNSKYKLGATQFADLLKDEFNEICSGFHPPLMTSVEGVKRFRYQNATELPLSVDWRKKGVVTSVKHQGHCGSCWAYSAIASVEGLTKIKTRKLTTSLTEQELMKKDNGGENKGCDGGNMDKAFDFIANDETHQSIVTGYEHVPSNDEDALMKAVSFQPVSVAIDATGYAMQLYAGGVLTAGSGDVCGRKVNHGMTVVGYGEEKGVKYWILKNSWGTEWGENGYLRLERGVNKGMCGIAMHASYPTTA